MITPGIWMFEYWISSEYGSLGSNPLGAKKFLPNPSALADCDNMAICRQKMPTTAENISILRMTEENWEYRTETYSARLFLSVCLPIKAHMPEARCQIKYGAVERKTRAHAPWLRRPGQLCLSLLICSHFATMLIYCTLFPFPSTLTKLLFILLLASIT